MIRPTPRAVSVFAVAAPVSLVLVVIDAALWPFGGGLLVLAVLCTGVDAILATPARGLSIAIDVPDALYVGDSDDLAVSLSVAPGRRGVVAESRAWQARARVRDMGAGARAACALQTGEGPLAPACCAVTGTQAATRSTCAGGRTGRSALCCGP